MVDFEWTVKLGDVLTVAGALFVGGSILYKRGGSEAKSGLTLINLTGEFKDMKEELKGLAKVITQLAVQDTKLTNVIQQVTMLSQTVEDLRRGAGWVATPARKSVDGQY
jgi:hypothetical protein